MIVFSVLNPTEALLDNLIKKIKRILHTGRKGAPDGAEHTIM